MRKLISIIFISVFCSNTLLADEQCTADTCKPGNYCSPTSGCTSCADGTYRSATDPIDQCIQCKIRPDGAKFNGPGTAADKCPWQITCDAGYGFDLDQKTCTACPDDQFQPYEFQITGTGNGDDAKANGGCMACGANSSPNDEHTACICKDGYHVSNSDNNTNITYTDYTLSCTANKYVITYVFDTNKPEYDQTQDVYYDIEFTTLTEKDYGGKITGKTISNWILESDNNKSLAAGKSFQYTYTTNITLTAVWTGKTFTVTYDTDDATDSDCTPADQTCTYGDTNCRASYLLNTCTYNGYVFKGWKCRSGCENSNETINPGETINPDDDIFELSDGNDINITLTAQWGECSAGYYCPDIKTENKCPAGSTSAAKSTAITNCYMTGDTTQICDGNTPANCFILPKAVGNIFYRGTQQ